MTWPVSQFEISTMRLRTACESVPRTTAGRWRTRPNISCGKRWSRKPRRLPIWSPRLASVFAGWVTLSWTFRHENLSETRESTRELSTKGQCKALTQLEPKAAMPLTLRPLAPRSCRIGLEFQTRPCPALPATGPTHTTTIHCAGTVQDQRGRLLPHWRRRQR